MNINVKCHFEKKLSVFTLIVNENRIKLLKSKIFED